MKFWLKNHISNLCILAIFALSVALFAFNAKIYGDIFRYVLPLSCLILPFWRKDFELFKELVFALICASLATYLIKFMILQISSDYAEFLSFAIRPINGEFSGFPSGHTTTAFVGFAFASFYFGKKWQILFFILALMVGISRILSFYHTPLQVLCGAILGFGVSFLVIRFLQNRAI